MWRLRKKMKENKLAADISNDDAEHEEEDYYDEACMDDTEDINMEDMDYHELETSALSTDDENDEDVDDTDDDKEFDESKNNIVWVDSDTGPADEPKFVVFYSMLVQIFSLFCFNCKHEQPKVQVLARGSMVTVVQDCLTCGKVYKWHSQPFIFGKYPAGNVMMSFGILMSGVQISQILLAFKHMGLSAISPRTYFYHQSKLLFPSVTMQWKKYQSDLIKRLQNLNDVTWSGDGRFDSMGHNAKYGTYTMFCNSISKLVHFELLQSNQAGSSNNMEPVGAQRAFKFIKDNNLNISIFVSDRHRTIAKWIRECEPQTTHFYDLWHVCKGISKKIRTVGQEKGNEILLRWMKAIKKHLYWSATSTQQGFGNLIVAKWASLIRHVADKHDNHPNEIYKECAHDELEARDWIYVGTQPYDRLKTIILNHQVIEDVRKLSSDAQTSCLEAFHSLLNQWHPKMTHFSWLGTKCRHILAICHFNENVLRQQNQLQDGSLQYNVVYPKFKLGEEVVKEVAVPPTYRYVCDIKNTMLSSTLKEMKYIFDLSKEHEPEPLDRQFERKKSKAEAIGHHLQRKQTATTLFPDANQQYKLKEDEQQQMNSKKEHCTRTCRKCHQPMKGHPRGKCPSPALS
ncbi:uncharacterized protein LOC135692501 [Rhopilema esculentum]